MSDALQGISRASSQQWTVLSRASSLGDFELVDPEPEVDPAEEDVQSNVDMQSADSGPTADAEEVHSESEAESDFEEIMAEAEIEEENPPAEACELSVPQVAVESLDSDDESQFDDVVSVASADLSETHPMSDAEVADESCHSEADLPCDKSDYTVTSDSAASAQIPAPSLASSMELPFEESAAPVETKPVAEASPADAANVESSSRVRHRRSMAPAEVNRFADTMRQNAKHGLAEAVRLINCVDDRLDSAAPHVFDGMTYCKQQVKADFQSTSKDMRDAFGERQEAEPSVAATFSHFKAQFKNDFKNIRKDVDLAFGCVLDSAEMRDGPDALGASDRRQKKMKTAIPAATCSVVSVAVAAWLVPVRLARFAVANIAM